MCNLIPPTFFPKTFSSESYQTVFNTPHLAKAYLNSLIIAVLSTALTNILAAPTAYVATQYKRPITIGFLLFAFITQMVPAVSLGVPLFQLLEIFGLLETTIGLTLAHATNAVPLSLAFQLKLMRY